jgi:hypothetical protein
LTLQAQLQEAEQSFGQEHNGGGGDGDGDNGDGDGAREGGDGGVGIAERMDHRPEAELMQVWKTRMEF